ncbi:alpha-mannosidase, partial [Streptomyces sp. MBT97]|uniref:alpha-mannosidase n=1 Tax=Streptomyces sp. MBT97 TaxID=2800411 RepID=UPI00190CB2AD
ERVERVHNQRVKPAIYAAAVPFEVEAWQAPGEPVPFAEAAAAAYEPFAMDTPWGPPWGTTWFRMRGQVPAEWAGRRVEAVIDLGFVGDWPGNQAEALVHLTDGTPLKAVNPLNQYVPIGNPSTGGEVIDYLVEAASNPDILANDGEHEPRRHEIMHALDRAMDALDLDDVSGSAAAVRAVLAPVLASPAHASAHTISGVGHAHIDSAWLWPIRETKRKTSRTFSNVTSLAEEYDDFIFACSQAQQYEWVRDNYPQVWARIQESVKKGQWAPVGGMWVESDGNLPGGEAIARQLVHGKRFFIEHFGIETKGVWLPDSFGYNAAYPQLAKLAGNDWFLTQKISWNQTNKFPHHTFWWEGIDGTRIFTHFPPVDTYNARFSGEEMDRAVRNYSEKGGGSRSLAPFGWGDGGGGPTREIMERARRLADLEGSPKVVVEHPDAFFAKAREEYPDAPVWVGELYLELHRATYTTQARTKQGNRRSEHKLREAELWATTAALHAPGYAYPYAALDRLWKTVLLHQFHDILPGSSIAWVHREAEAEYARVAEELEVLTADAVAALSGGRGGDTARVFNTSPYDRAEVVRTPAGAPAYVEVPANGSAPLAGAEPARPVTVSGRVLDNGLVRVEVAEDGTLSSVFDLRADREVLADQGNLLRLHTDLPNYWDAWDIDKHYQNRYTDLLDPDSVTVVEEDPLVGAIRVTRSFGKGSTITQTITLRAGSPRIDFETDIDWHEAEKILKAAFPVDIRAPHSSAEIQFGHIQRPTHTNTSWEAARFEVSGHRWVHIGEPGYGVAVINDSTYGHDVSRTVREDGGTTTTVRLSLVRAPRIPDPEADQGRHRFAYALLPGASIEDAVAEGYSLNLPLRVADATDAAPGPVVSVDGDGVTVEAVKLADDESGDVVVRLYESRGGRATGVLRTGFPLAGAQVTDLLERPLEPEVVGEDGSVAVTLRPFQILTLRLERQPSGR